MTLMVMLTAMIMTKTAIKVTPTVTVMVIATTMMMDISIDADGRLDGVVLSDKHTDLWNPLWNSLHTCRYASCVSEPGTDQWPCLLAISSNWYAGVVWCLVAKQSCRVGRSTC